jgi:hypothetical protein
MSTPLQRRFYNIKYNLQVKKRCDIGVLGVSEPYACFLVMSLCTGHLFALLCGQKF